MITNGLILIISLFIQLFALIFSVFNFLIPDEIIAAIHWFLYPINYLRGWVDINTALQVTLLLSVLAGYMYALKIARWVYAHLPWVGKHKKLPHHSISEN